MNMSEPKQFKTEGLRGEMRCDVPMSRHTSWRAGGAAERMYQPADLNDLLAFLRGLPDEEPLNAVGLGSNLLVRDGGLRGTVLLLHGALGGLRLEADGSVYAEAGVPGAKLARFAALHNLRGAEFCAGIPGTVGGAVIMNAGCYGAETVNVLESARVMDRTGKVRDMPLAELGYTYRHSAIQDGDVIVLGAIYRGIPDDPAAIRARMAQITARRETTQPIRDKTGGSTFKNPPGHSSWKLVDEAGWRGKLFTATGGGAMFSPLHSNFMINPGEATAADLEGLGEAVRTAVKTSTGIQLDWEIKRIGRSLPPKE